MKFILIWENSLTASICRPDDGRSSPTIRFDPSQNMRRPTCRPYLYPQSTAQKLHQISNRPKHGARYSGYREHL